REPRPWSPDDRRHSTPPPRSAAGARECPPGPAVGRTTGPDNGDESAGSTCSLRRALERTGTGWWPTPAEIAPGTPPNRERATAAPRLPPTSCAMLPAGAVRIRRLRPVGAPLGAPC